MTAYTRPFRLAAPLLITLLALTTSVMASEVVEPGETQEFTGGDDCEFTPFTDTLLKGTIARCLPPARAEAAALLSISAINNDVTSFATLITEFLVTPGSETVLDATVSAVVDWEGVLFGAGVVGAGASVTIEMFLVDDTNGTIKGQTVVLNKSQDSGALKGIDVGGTRVSGNRAVSFNGTVVRGHEHSIRLKLTCTAGSGLIGLSVGCIFYDDVIFGIDLSGDPHAQWTSLSITVEQDIFERLDQIDMKLEEMDMKLDAMEMKLGEMDTKLDSLLEGQNEIQRLLLTPQGRRSSSVGDFPLHPSSESDDEPGIDEFCAAQELAEDCSNADWLDDESESRRPRDCRWRHGACQAR
jgi:hypothetical protein